MRARTHTRTHTHTHLHTYTPTPTQDFADTRRGKSYRMNLTFRHAPELIGQEGGDRFFHFGECLFVANFRQMSNEEGWAICARVPSWYMHIPRAPSASIHLTNSGGDTVVLEVGTRSGHGRGAADIQ